MVTGASTANVALILIDVRNGVIEQTKRHAIISSLLQIPHLVVCINKMDLVNYSQEQYDKIKTEFEQFASKLDVVDVSFIPISALNGDNVVSRSMNMSWYEGSTLMYYLENVHIASDHNLIDNRFPVQYIIRPYSNEYHDYRGYAGRVAGGTFSVGDEVVALPSGFHSNIKSIQGPKGNQTDAIPPESVTILLEDDIDVSRGDMIVRPNNQPEVTQDVDVMICWFDNNKSLLLRGKYVIRHSTQEARCIIKEIKYKLDIKTLSRDQANPVIKANDIARVQLRSTKPLFLDSYKQNRITGSIILIDEVSNNTVGVGMVI
jgi:sulfate adenylyltransferase subunit 1